MVDICFCIYFSSWINSVYGEVISFLETKNYINQEVYFSNIQKLIVQHSDILQNLKKCKN